MRNEHYRPGLVDIFLDACWSPIYTIQTAAARGFLRLLGAHK